MKQIKTVTSVTTTESEIPFDTFYPYVWIENQGESDCYAANYAGLTAQSVDVVLIKAGTSKRIDARTKSIYVKTASGTTTLEAHGQNDAVCPFKKQGKGGEQITVESLTATENITYTAPSGTAYSPVTVSVSPNVGTKTITQDGTYNASSDNLDGYSSVVVDTTPHLPSGYTAIDYVECPSISEQCGFPLTTYTQQKGDIHFAAVEPTRPGGEQGFAGIADYAELYYNNNTLTVWGISSSALNISGSQSISTGNTYNSIAAFSQTFSSQTPWTIGYYSLNNYCHKGRIHGYKIYRSATNDLSLIHQLVPCIRDSDSKVGMYDMIGNTFYSSTTGTEFVAPASI